MVRWTDHALAQLRSIHDHIAKDSPVYAKKVSQTIVQKSLLLNDLPHFGKMVPELREESVREFPIYSYRLIYEIKDANILILSVIHKRRDLQAGQIPRVG